MLTPEDDLEKSVYQIRSGARSPGEKSVGIASHWFPSDNHDYKQQCSSSASEEVSINSWHEDKNGMDLKGKNGRSLAKSLVTEQTN